MQILREDIDRFGQDKGPPAPPYCQITVFLTPSSDSVPFINYCVPLKGVTSATKMLFIKCFPPTLEQGLYKKTHFKRVAAIVFCIIYFIIIYNVVIVSGVINAVVWGFRYGIFAFHYEAARHTQQLFTAV